MANQTTSAAPKRLWPIAITLKIAGPLIILAAATLLGAKAFDLAGNQHRREALGSAARGPVLMGTIATCSEIRGFGQCSRKDEFKPGDEVWVYSEARNVSVNRRIDVTFGIDLISPNGRRQSRHYTQGGNNIPGDGWSVDDAKFQLAADSLPGKYTVQVVVRNNLTAQTGEAATGFNVYRRDQTTSYGPQITSPVPVLAQARQTITILGNGFGYQIPYDGNSPHILVSDLTGHWNAGNSGDGDLVTLDVVSWTDTQIKIEGFTGSYGDQWHLNSGDIVRIQIWNPQTGAGPATSTVAVISGKDSDPETEK